MKRIFKLTGNRKRELELTGTETIEEVCNMLAKASNVNPKSWCIYIDSDRGLRRISDTSILASDIPEQLYFYPNVERI